MIVEFKSATGAWLHVLSSIIARGAITNPRGMPTREVLHNSVAFNMLRPVVSVPARKLSYKFLAAEAFWILSGDNRVETIAPYNKNIAQFSDDGKTFFGAYGPKVAAQIDFVVKSLLGDRMTRQAVITLWRENPPATKDVPCTVALTFNIRDGRLNCHVFMRSSDAWLGFPYDVFNFSMIALNVLSSYNENVSDPKANHARLGTLYFTAVSSHLYQKNWEDAATCFNFSEHDAADEPLHDMVYLRRDFDRILEDLCALMAEKETKWQIRPR